MTGPRDKVQDMRGMMENRMPGESRDVVIRRLSTTFYLNLV